MDKPSTRQRNPYPTVDIIIKTAGGGVVLIERKNPPYGWALPGGFVDVGETLEEAARREALEETSLEVTLLCQMHAYSDPARDARSHNLSVVFAATAKGVPAPRDDAKDAGVFTEDEISSMELAFDHSRILTDYFEWNRAGFKVFELNPPDSSD